MSTTIRESAPKKTEKINVYFLAAPEDEEVCKAIKKYLTPVIRNSQIPIEIESDFEIPAGEDVEKYKQKLYQADIVLAFISADYINDDETYLRTQKVIEKYNRDEIIMLPILVRNCLWKSTPFVNLPLLPKNFQPLNNKQFWNSEDDALTSVATDIYEAIKSFTYEELEIAVPEDVKIAELPVEAEVAEAPSEAETIKFAPEVEIKDEQEPIVEEAKKVGESKIFEEKPVEQDAKKADQKSVTPKTKIQTRTPIPIDVDWRKSYYKNVLWKRAAAFLLDNFLVLFPALLLGGIISASIIGDKEPTEDQWALWGLFDIALYVAICAAMEASKWRGTFGKMIMKLQITDREGHPISFFKAFWRNIARFITGYAYVFVIPLVIQYFTFKKSKKLFHDQLSNTVIGEKLR